MRERERECVQRESRGEREIERERKREREIVPQLSELS